VEEVATGLALQVLTSGGTPSAATASRSPRRFQRQADHGVRQHVRAADAGRRTVTRSERPSSRGRTEAGLARVGRRRGVLASYRPWAQTTRPMAGPAPMSRSTRRSRECSTRAGDSTRSTSRPEAPGPPPGVDGPWPTRRAELRARDRHAHRALRRGGVFQGARRPLQRHLLGLHTRCTRRTRPTRRTRTRPPSGRPSPASASRRSGARTRCRRTMFDSGHVVNVRPLFGDADFWAHCATTTRICSMAWFDWFASRAVDRAERDLRGASADRSDRAHPAALPGRVDVHPPGATRPRSPAARRSAGSTRSPRAATIRRPPTPGRDAGVGA
jgi:hypothetical protein